MNEMIIAVGKNVIQDNTFEEVIFNQNKILIEFFVEQFSDNLEFRNEYEITDEEAHEIYLITKKILFNDQSGNNFELGKDFMKKWEMKAEIEKEYRINLLNFDERLIIEKFDYYKIFENYYRKIYPILQNSQNLEEHFDEKMTDKLKMKIIDVPF